MTERIVPCWADWRTSTFEDGSPEYWGSYTSHPVNGTCLLPDGHDGPHEFTLDSDLVITFNDAYEGQG